VLPLLLKSALRRRSISAQARESAFVEMLVKLRFLDRRTVRFKNPANIKGLAEKLARRLNRMVTRFGCATVAIGQACISSLRRRGAAAQPAFSN
jgi:hypothetical protein